MNSPFSKYLILAGLLCSAGIFLCGCKGDMRAIQEIGEKDVAPFQTIRDGFYQFTDSGKTRNTLQAGLLEQYITETEYTDISQGLVLDIYNPQEELAGRLQSRRGHYYKAEGRMVAMDSVVFSSPKGDTLFTDQLTWYSDSNLVYTDKRVRIIRDGTEILGKGLRANEDFSRYTILAPVGDITVPKDNP